MKITFLAATMILTFSGISYAADMVGDAAKGKALYAACSGCHGSDAMGNEALKAPRLAGQHSWYIVTQLKNFKAGIRGSAEGDIGGAMMQPMAGLLADDQAIYDVATYVESLN